MKSFSKRDRSILIANLLDHFDGALYGFLAPVMAEIFFPKHDPIIQIILAYSLFATSLVTRPIGAIIFGYLAKKHGPIKPLSYSLIGVGICSVLVGFVPGYDKIGYGAAAILLFLRFIKGVFSAGESAIAKLYILDGKEKKNSYKASYLYHASSMLGIIVASAASTFVYLYDHPEFWRICYILGGVLGLYAYILRKEQPDLSESKEIQIEKINWRSLWKYRFPLLAIIFTTGLSHITYLVPCVIMNSLVPFVSNIDIDEMMLVNNFLLIFDLVLIMIIGPIMSRFDYLKVKTILPLMVAISVPILFLQVKDAGIIYVSFVRFWIVALGVVFMIPQNIFYKNMFDGLKSKYLVIGIANSIGAATIGKLTPVIMFYLYYKFENMLLPGLYITLVAILTSYFVWKSKKV